MTSSPTTPTIIERVATTIAVLFVGGALLAVVIDGLWGAIPSVLTNSRVHQALAISVASSLISTVVCVMIGAPAATFVVRSQSRWCSVVRLLLVVPMVLPPVVSGIALLRVFGRESHIGALLANIGIQLPFSFFGLVVAQVFVSLPFVFAATERAARRSFEKDDAVAALLGASKLRRFGVVGLGRIRPDVTSGAIMAWARAFGEFGATLTFAGSISGRTETLPEVIYLALGSTGDEAVVLGAAMVLVAGVVMAVALRTTNVTQQ